MKTSKTTNLLNSNNEIIGIRVQKFNNGVLEDQFDIPVLDVRRSEEERKRVYKMISASNQSKYTKPSFSVMGFSYQVSHKKN